MVDLKSLGEATVGLAILKSESGKKLLAPVAEQLGAALGDLGSIYRFYQADCLEKIFTKWAASRGDKPGLTPEEWLKVMPLLQLASAQGDEELQKRWAVLLEHTVTTTNGFLPSFGQTLSQLTSDEAKFLDRLFVVASKPMNYTPAHHPGPGRDPLHYVEMMETYDPSIDTRPIDPKVGPPPWLGADRGFLEDQIGKKLAENYEKKTQAELVFHDLERLGIITREEKFSSSPAYSFTQYGLSFVRAVTPR
jgi:hypothetical protein